jgi:hypothetical protein
MMTLRRSTLVLLLSLVLSHATGLFTPAHCADPESVVLDSLSSTDVFAKARILEMQKAGAKEVELYHVGNETPIELEALARWFQIAGIQVHYKKVTLIELDAQVAEHELMPFRVLDACLHLYAGEKMSPDEVETALASVFPGASREQTHTWAFRFTDRFTQSIYKWVQSPLSLHVGSLDLERERALQMPVVQKTEWTHTTPTKGTAARTTDTKEDTKAHAQDPNYQKVTRLSGVRRKRQEDSPSSSS